MRDVEDLNKKWKENSLQRDEEKIEKDIEEMVY